VYTDYTTIIPQLTGVDPLPDGETVPADFTVAQNQPNPFGAFTEIRYGIPVDADVCLIIYSTTGRRVRTLVDERQAAGFRTVRWDGRDARGREVASGIYFYRFEAGGLTQTRKMLLLR
jgi:hypothetical protein